MALGFLNDIAGAASGIGGIMNALGVGKPKMNYGPTPSEAQANSLFQALLDPNNSLVKQNTDVNMQNGMQELLMTLRKMQMQGARAQGRGMNNPFFNPERMDENMNFMLTRGQPAIAADARTRATTDIRNTATSLAGFGEAEQKRRNQQQTNAGVDYQKFQTAGGYKQIGGGLQELLKILMPQQQEQLPWRPGYTAQPLPWLQNA